MLSRVPLRCVLPPLRAGLLTAERRKMDVAAADAGSGIACPMEVAPTLLLDPGYLMVVAFYGSCLVLLLMFIHYIQPLAKEATRLSKLESSPETFQAVVFCRTVNFTTSDWLWMRHADWPWLEAEFEGDAFDNFVITMILEAVLNGTSTANTHLEGDLEFSNDPSRSVIIILWILCAMEWTSIFLLLSENRRSKGKPCWCLKPHQSSNRDARGTLVKMERRKHKMVVVQLITWSSLVHDAFQITISSVATASQVASAGAPRSAMFINSIEVSALVFVKCFNLYTWADTWKEQDGKAKLKRVQKQFAAVMGAVRTRIVAVSAMMGTKKSSDSEPQGVDEEQLSSANDNPGKV